MGTVLNILCFFGMRAFFQSVCVPLCFVYSSEGRKEGVHHLLKEFFGAKKFQYVDFVLCE